jgi:two-component system NtrC family sensor kinase
MNYPDLLATHFSFPLPEKIGVQDHLSTTQELYDKKTGKMLQVSIFPYYSPEGNFIGSVQVAKDITEKKEAEIRLIMNERLAALGQMASGIAHEIRNPLATIRACAEGLLQRMEKKQINAALFESYLKIIDEEIILCTRIITSMLSFLRKKGEGKEDVESQVDIHEVLDRTLEMISFQGRLKEVEVLKNYQERMPLIRGNEGELRQVFIAIILNALDAMEDKGRLELETAIEGNAVFIKIRDTGPGIPSDFMGRIFDPFFTTRPEKGGTGLGLSIANKIIKENNGEIGVATNEGKGTTFTITLPRQTASGKMPYPSGNLPD